MNKSVLYIVKSVVSSENVNEFDEWYHNKHIPEIVACSECKMARRFKAIQQEDKFEVIKHLLKRIHHAHPNFDFQQAYRIVYEREQQLHTGIGCGVAIPHGRIPLP